MKAWKFVYSLLIAACISPVCGGQTFAQEGRTEAQQIQAGNGDTFMQEESPPPRRPVAKSTARSDDGAGGPPRETIEGAGGTFMEEVTPDAPHRKGHLPVDLSNVGVQVDRQGNIIPLRQPGRGLVQQQYNSGIQAYQEMPVPTSNIYGAPGTTFLPVAPGTVPGIRSMNLPYGYYPAGVSRLGGPAIGLSPYGLAPYGAPGYGLSPYGIPLYGYGSYSGYGGYRPGLNLYLPPTRQYSYNYSQTSIVGPQSSMIMPLFQDDY